MTKKTKTLIRVLCAVPLVIGVLQALFGFLGEEYLRLFLLGIVLVFVGGTLLGYIANRWLAVSTGSWDTMIPLAAVSALGLITVGIVYYLLIPDPIATLTLPQRVSVQLLVFIQFLACIGLGITLVPSRLF